MYIYCLVSSHLSLCLCLSVSPSLSLLGLPSPPRWRDHPEGLPSVEQAPPNGFPSAIAAQLSQIPESPNITVSSDLSLSQFQARIEQLKTQVQQKHQNGGNAPSPPSGANGSVVDGLINYSIINFVCLHSTVLRFAGWLSEAIGKRFSV